MTVLRIGFFVYEYPPQFVGGLGTYAEYITHEYVDIGHDVSVFTLNNNGLKTKEILRGVEVHRPLIVDASNIWPFFVVDDLKSGAQTSNSSMTSLSTTFLAPANPSMP